jgi:hypothetical protein
MAQWKSGPFDLVWHCKLQTALLLIRAAADRWILRGKDALHIDQVSAILVRVLTAPWSEFDIRFNRCPIARRLDEWLGKTGSLETELARLNVMRTPNSMERVAAELRTLLKSSAHDWSLKGAEIPSSETVVIEFADILFRSGAVRRPAPRTFDAF